jgi:hypothetical protein
MKDAKAPVPKPAPSPPLPPSQPPAAARREPANPLPKAQPPKAAPQAAAPCTPSFAAVAAKASAKVQPPASRPSLIITLSHSADETLKGVASALPATLVPVCNEALISSAAHANVRVSAARWTAKGNLVLTAGPDTTLAQLTSASSLLTSAIQAHLPSSPSCSSRANVRWSKLLINSVPTGVTGDRAHAYTAAECHQALIADNLSYRRLRVTQLPSWVKRPSSYLADSCSSLAVAFEDPDGTTASSLVSARHLFLFGAQATIKKWKQKPPPPKLRRKVVPTSGTQPSGPAPAPATGSMPAQPHPTPPNPQPQPSTRALRAAKRARISDGPPHPPSTS